MMLLREKVYDTISSMDTFTVPEVVESLGASQDDVRRVLRYFEKAGIVTRNGKKQTALDGGRPAIVWKVN